MVPAGTLGIVIEVGRPDRHGVRSLQANRESSDPYRRIANRPIPTGESRVVRSLQANRESNKSCPGLEARFRLVLRAVLGRNRLC